MSFDIARTPTLEAVATQDEQLLAQDLQKRVEQALQTAETQEDVVEASRAQRGAEDRLAKLRRAERTLSDFAKASREQARSAMESALEGVIESAISAEKPEFKKLPAVLALENQNRFSMRAIEELVERRIPLAQIASLREESHALMTRARAVEAIAQERAEKILGQVREAVTEEMVLPIDLSKGVSGALLAHAGGLKRVAVQISANADELERAYTDRRRA